MAEGKECRHTPESALPDGFVELKSSQTGRRVVFFAWDVVKIEEGTTPGAGKIEVHRGSGAYGCGYEGYTVEEVRVKVWAALQRGAAATVLARMNREGIGDVVEALIAPVTKRTLGELDEALQAQIEKLLPKMVTAYLEKLGGKKKK